MYKMLIADDEQIVLDGLRFMVENNFKDIAIVATAKTGREAIEESRKHMLDIIFTDIKMPGINGIEAIAEIRKHNSDVKVVVLSAYEQFDYAKQAVELGVADYLLKPVHEEKLVEVLGRLLEKIRAERESKARDMENREKLEKLLPVLEHGFIYSLLLNTDYGTELSRYKELFDMDKDHGYIMVFEFGEGEGAKTIENRIGSGVMAQQLYPRIQAAVKYKCKAIVGPLIINRITVLVYDDAEGPEYEHRIKAMALCQSIVESIAEDRRGNLFAGIGSRYPLAKIRNSLEEALHALGRAGSARMMHFNDLTEQSPAQAEYTYVEIKDDENAILKLIDQNRTKELEMAVTAFIQKLERKCGYVLEDVKHLATELMVMVYGHAYRNSLREKELGYATYLKELERIDSLVNLQQWCTAKTLLIARLLESKENRHVSEAVRQARQYIDEHYNEEISLNDVSKTVSISPQYFSTIFKEELGISFVEYIRMKRIETAKAMLKEKKHSVKEVCYEIGYNDPNYFSRLFKRIVGVSPTEYGQEEEPQ